MGTDDPPAGRLFPLYPSGHRGRAQRVQRYVAGFHPEKIILREKDLDAIEPLMRTHLYGGVSRMGSKIYSDEYRGYFKLPEGK